MSEGNSIMDHDIGTHGGTYNNNGGHADRLAKIKLILAGWYIDKPNGETFHVWPGVATTVMHISWSDGRHGLTSAEEVIGLVLLGCWRRVYSEEERTAATTKVLG